MRKNIKGYLGFRWLRTESKLEIHSEKEPSPWDMTRAYDELENTFYPITENNSTATTITQTPPTEDEVGS
jgi:hypothetical protein